jgi:hypothetical protein
VSRTPDETGDQMAPIRNQIRKRAEENVRFVSIRRRTIANASDWVRRLDDLAYAAFTEVGFSRRIWALIAMPRARRKASSQ